MSLVLAALSAFEEEDEEAEEAIARGLQKGCRGAKTETRAQRIDSVANQRQARVVISRGTLVII